MNVHWNIWSLLGLKFLRMDLLYSSWENRDRNRILGDEFSSGFILSTVFFRVLLVYHISDGF